MPAEGPSPKVAPRPDRPISARAGLGRLGGGEIRPQHLYKTVGLFLLVLVVASKFDAISQVLLMVYASAILAVALNTIVTLIPHHRRWMAGLLGVAIFGGIGLALWFGVPALAEQLRGLTGDFPTYRQQLERWSQQLRALTGLNLDLFSPRTREIFSGAVSGGNLLGTARGIVEVLFLPLVLIMGALYAAAAPNDRLLVPILRAVPPHRRDQYRRLFELLAVRLRAWVKGVLLSMVMVGGLTWVGLTLLGVPYALLLAVLAGLSEIVPLIGPWASGVLVVGVALLNDPTSALWAAILMLAIQQIESNLITPMVMARVAEVHPFITLFALFLGATLFGIMGILLAIPLVLLVWTVIEVFWVDGALGSDHEPIEPLVEE